jgi:hypothetical protein
LIDILYWILQDILPGALIQVLFSIPQPFFYPHAGISMGSRSRFRGFVSIGFTGKL